MKHLHTILNDEFKIRGKKLESSYKSQKAVPDDIDNKVYEDFDLYKKLFRDIKEI